MPFPTNHGHFGNTWESSPVGAKVDEGAVPENSMPSLEGDGNKTLATPKQELSGVGAPASTFNKLLAAGDGSGALEDVGTEIPACRAQRHHSYAEGTKMILSVLTALRWARF